MIVNGKFSNNNILLTFSKVFITHFQDINIKIIEL